MNTTLSYGSSTSQVADLHLPDADRPPVVCLLHGGFWRVPYGRDELTAMAEDLALSGFAVWNIEYRRVGEAGGGWPGTLQDVADAIDRLAQLSRDHVRLDLDRVALVGHSAGGQLALAAAAGAQGVGARVAPRRVRPIAVAGLAALTDLDLAYRLDCGNGAVKELIGGTPDEFTDRYDNASPLRLLPLRIAQLIVHGTADTVVPVEMARHYVDAATGAGDTVYYVER
ncbi:MAG TPA: alpha/beta fold hydrolase, partial [Dokdonella sp.]|nr:alpha/beta fold hydrolase [Dokdonella sp.]